MAMQIPGVGAQGAWKTIKDLVADTVGPMALLGVAAQKFVTASAGAALNAQKMAEALKASDGAERLKQQFEQLLGSSSRARKQIEMLAKVASGSAFSFDSLADASKNLQVLTNGALNSEKALKKVQDVAAATGAPVDTMATAVADLYNALKSGDGVEAASSQLKNMGAISDTTAQKLESLNAAGVSLAATWQVVEADLSKANGAASALGGTIAGLQQQLANVQQASNTKIGEMFAEGEKAGYRAAIGFEKFKSAVAEANAGPWAAFTGAINSVKEAVGGMLAAFAGTGAVKGIFEVFAKGAIAILVALNISIVACLPLLLRLATAAGGAAAGAMGKMAAAAGLNVGALGRMAMALKGLAFNPLTVGLTVASALLIDLVGNAIAATQSIGELKDKLKSFGSERDSALGDTRAESVARTPEERDAGIKNAQNRIEQSEARKKSLQEQVDKAREIQSATFMGISSYSMADREAAKQREAIAGRGIEQENAFQGMQKDAIDQLAGRTVGFDAKRLEIARQRLEVEKEIAEQARQRIQATASPQSAVKMAAAQKVKAQKELEYAEEATENRNKDEKALSDAKALFDKNKKEPIDYGIFDIGATSDSGKIDAEIAKRTAMAEEEKAALKALPDGQKTSSRLEAVRAQMSNLKNPITGEMESDGMVSGMDRLQVELKDAKERENTIAKRTALENAAIVDQQATEAEAADKASNEAGQRKLNIQKQLAALQGLEGGDGKAAEAELGPEIAQLKKKQEAVAALKDAEDAYDAAQKSGDKGKIAAAEANFNQKRTAAFGEGMKEGDTVESVNQEVQATTNILNIRKQQAAIEQAAAKRRRDDIMQELNVMRQIAQIEMDRAGGRSSKKNEFDVRQGDRDKQRADLQRAEALVAQRDAATDPDVIQALKAQLKGVGQDEGVTAEDINSKRKSLNLEEASDRTKVRQFLRESAIAGQLAIARSQEEYGPTQDAQFKGKSKREELEDKLSREQKTAEYQKGGMGQKDAENMAAYDQRRERIAAKLEEAGNQRVDSLTAVGGGATAMVGPVADTASLLKDLNKINQQQGDLLAKILKKSEDQEALVRPLINGSK